MIWVFSNSPSLHEELAKINTHEIYQAPSHKPLKLNRHCQATKIYTHKIYQITKP